MTELANFSADSKVWIYQADRAFTEAETTVIGTRLAAFVADWAAHGRGLKAWGGVVHQHFIVLVVDEQQYGASGCSIDSSVRMMKEIETSYGVQLFNRLLIAYRVGEEVRCTDRKGLEGLLERGEIDEDTITFNNLVDTKAKWEDSWEIPLKESWLWRSLV